MGNGRVHGFTFEKEGGIVLALVLENGIAFGKFTQRFCTFADTQDTWIERIFDPIRFYIPLQIFGGGIVVSVLPVIGFADIAVSVDKHAIGSGLPMTDAHGIPVKDRVRGHGSSIGLKIDGILYIALLTYVLFHQEGSHD